MAAQQIMFPWGQYKTSELARVLGVSRGKTLTALRRLGLVEERVYHKGIPADQSELVAAEVEKIASELQARAAAAETKRAAKADRKAARQKAAA